MMNRFSKPLLPYAGLAALALSFATPASAGWRRLTVDELTSHPKNLLRSHLETRLITIDEGAFSLGVDSDDKNLSAVSLLLDDPAIGWPAPIGNTQHEFDLSAIEVISKLSLANIGGAGKVTVFSALTSADAANDRWREVGFSVFDAKRRNIQINLGGVDTRRLLVKFEMAAAGKIHALSLFGEPQANQFAIADAPEGETMRVSATEGDQTHLVSVNLASVYALGRPLYVSSGSGDPTALADGDPSTTFTFDEADERPTAIFELSSGWDLSRTSALLAEEGNALVHTYVVNELPEIEDWIGHTTIDLDRLDELQPNGQASGETGALAMEMSDESTGRYLIFRFDRTDGDGVVEVSELAAFSDAAADMRVQAVYQIANTNEGGKNPARASDQMDRRHYGDTYAYNNHSSGAAFYGYGTRGGVGGIGGISGGGSGLGVRNLAEDTERNDIEALVEDTLDASDELRAPVLEAATVEGVFEGVYIPADGVLRSETVEGGESEVGSSGTYAPIIEVVSRIAVSATTVPGVGHLYYNAGHEEAPEGYTFVSPHFAATHPGGVIQSETVARYQSEVEYELTPGAPVPPAVIYQRTGNSPVPVHDAATAVAPQATPETAAE